MKISHWIAGALAMCGALPVHAQKEPAGVNGADLLASCRAGEPRCGAYLQGVLDMMIVERRDECGAPRYDRDRLRAVYVRWAEQNSYFQSVHMVAGAERAFAEAWPCRSSPTKP